MLLYYFSSIRHFLLLTFPSLSFPFLSFLSFFIPYFNKSPLFTTNASTTAIAAYNLFSASSKTIELSL